MKIDRTRVIALEDLPNIGKAIAADLRPKRTTRKRTSIRRTC